MILFKYLCIGLTAVLAIAIPVAAHAQTGPSHASSPATGKVIGTLVDSETRAPLVGGMVVIPNTNLGNVTNGDGYYFINDVPAGVVNIRAEYLGYASVTREVLVSADKTITVDFGLPSEVVLADAILAVVEREPIPISESVDRSYTMRSEIQVNVPDALPEETCRAPVTVHGSYIVDGKWQLQASVGQLICGNQKIECRPVVVYQPLDGSQPSVEIESPSGDPQ